MMIKSERLRVFVFGLDGATFTLLKPWLAQEKLPSFKKVLDAGAHGILKSTLPPLTPPGWTSSITGVNPGKHNIYGFFKPMRNGYRRQVYSVRDIKAPKLWEILDAYGKRSIILHLPLTYPVDSFNGLMVAGMLTPAEVTDYTHPPELREELQAVIKNYRPNADTYFNRSGQLADSIEEFTEVTRIHGQETLYLMDSKEWDLFFVMFHTPDLIQHMFWKFMDPRHRYYPGPNKFQNCILECYQQIDAILGQVIERLDPETSLVILSDHGFNMTEKNVFITNWLVQSGYLVLYRRKNLAFKHALFKAGFQRERLVKRLEALHLSWLPKLFPERLKNQVPRSRPSFKNIEDNIDWTRTRAYFPSAGGLAIYLNVKGREPLGIVEPGSQYEALRDEIIHGLKQLTDEETGQTVIKAIYKREEAYQGDYADNAPDMALLPEDGYFVNEGLGKEIITYAAKGNIERSGNHHPDGIVMLYGQHIRRGIEIQGAEIVDITPTILHLMRLPVQTYMDGKVLTAAIKPEYSQQRSIAYDVVDVARLRRGEFEYTDEEQASIEERLKAMGYM
jgi:predicted AlkP superfamily phosphohydrolase/phosphomutase